MIARARELREEIGSVGAYSHSQGVPLIRQSVAHFIEGAWYSLNQRAISIADTLQSAMGTPRTRTTSS